MPKKSAHNEYSFTYTIGYFATSTKMTSPKTYLLTQGARNKSRRKFCTTAVVRSESHINVIVVSKRLVALLGLSQYITGKNPIPIDTTIEFLHLTISFFSPGSGSSAERMSRKMTHASKILETGPEYASEYWRVNVLPPVVLNNSLE